MSRSTPTSHIGLLSEDDLWPRRDEPAVKGELACRFMAFAKSIALRYAGRAESTEDLVQVANLGLMGAIDRYDPGAGAPFVAFAAATINGELKRHFRDRVSSPRLPRSIYERVGQIRSVSGELRSELSREPAPADLADRIGCPVHDVLEAIEAMASRNPMSLGRGDDDEDGPYDSQVGLEDGGYERVERRMAAADALGRLDRADRRMILLRFRYEMSQSEIAEQIGCSQMQVSRRLRQILDTMNDAASGQYVPEAA